MHTIPAMRKYLFDHPPTSERVFISDCGFVLTVYVLYLIGFIGFATDAYAKRDEINGTCIYLDTNGGMGGSDLIPVYCLTMTVCYQIYQKPPYYYVFSWQPAPECVSNKRTHCLGAILIVFLRERGMEEAFG
jgi:hypothetical protein